MPLTPGTRLGPYEIVAPLGAGGMGEVYRATDSNLKRAVAIKVLPASVAGDADRLARFQREAEVLAALNHPNIAAVYGLEKTPDLTALVMELVEGEDLSAQIDRGQMSLSDILPIAKQIADALEAAHELGIVHRDLKPANIKVRADGTVKVLDFGLAKAMGAPGSEDPGLRSDVANSPTLTARGTQMGMILGTAAYMAPEQARGKAVDKRADIWAFGVVLYEMLSGRRAFEGDDISITLANVLKDDVRWDALPADLPPPITRLLRRCLEKDPKKRLRDIGEARLVLEDPSSLALTPVATSPAARPVATPRWQQILPWTLAAAGLGATAVLIVMVMSGQTPAAPELRRLSASLGADARLNLALSSPAIAVSPDGRTLVFIARADGPNSPSQLYMRRLDQLQAMPIAGTEQATAPFFSPTSDSIAFFQGNELKKIPVAGGPVLTICQAERGRGGAWGEDDTIIFSQLGSPKTTLLRVPAAGGTPVAFGEFGEGATSQRWPQLLPGSALVLYTEHSGVNNFDFANIVVVPLTGGAPKVVVRGGYFGRYVPTGHLTYMSNGTLMAVPFDLQRAEVTGQPVPMVEGIAAGDGGNANVAFLPDGTLVYVPSPVSEPDRAIDWLARDGKRSVLRSAKTAWRWPRFSPNGQYLALAEPRDGFFHIVVHDLARDTPTQRTFGSVVEEHPAWTPNSDRIAFSSDRGTRGVKNLWWIAADGSGEPVRLTTSPNEQSPDSWHPDGTFLAYTEIRANTIRDILILPVNGDAARGWTIGTPREFAASAVNESLPVFSPDGKWIAYVSAEAGPPGIYVSPFPGPGTKLRVGDGSGPRWSATRKELLFMSAGQIKSVTYTDAGAFVPGKATPWSAATGLSNGFDLHRDGERLAVYGVLDADAIATQRNALDKVVFVSGFFDYLRKNVVVK